jgi:hypothetical protein
MPEKQPCPIDHMIDVARGVVAADPEMAEHRKTRRTPYRGKLALVQRTPDGGRTIPITVDGKDISPGGMCVISRYMLHVGHSGAVLVRRSDGEQVMLGVRVAHCHYVGGMKHESGLEFTRTVDGITLEDFRDQTGRLPDLSQSAKAA